MSEAPGETQRSKFAKASGTLLCVLELAVSVGWSENSELPEDAECWDVQGCGSPASCQEPGTYLSCYSMCYTGSNIYCPPAP